MEHSESIKEIAAAMNKAQAEMTAAKKDSNNPFFKSKYADLGSVIKALKEAFADNGLSYIQSPFMAEKSVGVTTMIMHTSGEWIKGDLLVPMSKIDPQGAGSAITYARRYALQAMAGIPAADDDAEFAMGRYSEEYINTEQLAQLRGGMELAGIDEADICKKVRINKLEDLEASRFDSANKYIQSQAGK